MVFGYRPTLNHSTTAELWRPTDGRAGVTGELSGLRLPGGG